MEVYIGLDVSLASTALWVLGEKGEIVTEAQVASAPESLVSFMRDLPQGIAAIGLEAGPLSQWLHKGLTDAGFQAVLMETRQVKATLASGRSRNAPGAVQPAAGDESLCLKTEPGRSSVQICV